MKVANLRSEPKWFGELSWNRLVLNFSYKVSVGNDIWRWHIDQLWPGNMTSAKTSISDSDSIVEDPFHESSLHSSIETAQNTTESSTSIDEECCNPEREFVLLTDWLRILKLSIGWCSIPICKLVCTYVWCNYKGLCDYNYIIIKKSIITAVNILFFITSHKV